MARSFSSILLKSVAALPAARSSAFASGSFYQHGMRFSSTIPSDRDTHEDFRPTNKLESSGLSLKDIVEKSCKILKRFRSPAGDVYRRPPDLQTLLSPITASSRLLDVKDNPVMIYMKGVPDFPQCGFSSLAVRVLKLYNVPLSSRNILEDPEIKSAVKAFSNWPTFPQIFIKGEFVGGSDIILNMHQTGELKEKIKDIAADSK
ncbi:hypothetical protein LguiB_008255 [Lonicera macranthoides]